jgi:hypothetical protein
MSSVHTAPRSIPANTLWTNLKAVTATSVVDISGAGVSWFRSSNGVAGADFSTIGFNVGGVLLRDMGKNVFFPALTTGNAVGMTSSIYRKVQWVSQSNATGFYGTGSDSNLQYFTGYIPLGGQTYGGGTGVPSGFVRAN